MHPRSPLSVVLILSLTVELQIALSASAIAEQKMSGLIAEELTPESAADKAGLKLGDTIISYDGKPLASPAVFNAAQENTFAKKEVTLEVRRGEELLEIRVPMGVIGIRVRPALSPAVEDLYEQGKSGLKSKAADKVSAKWKAAAELAQQEGDEKAAAWLYGRIGETQEHQQRCTEAREAFSMAWKLFKDSSDAAARAIIARGLGRCSGRSGDLVAAQSWFEQAQRLDLDAGNEFWLARDLNGLGIVAYERGDLDASYGYHTRALSIRERLAPDSRDVADSLDNLGNIEIDRGGLRAAQGFYLRALSVYEHLSPDSLDLAGTLDNLGNVASDRGDLRAAEEYHTRALSIRERLAPDSQDVAESLNNLGNVSIGRGDLKAAWYFYDRALSLHERLAPDSLEVAGSLGNMGVVARDRGDLQTANDYLTRALKIEERLAPNSIDVAASFSDLGSLASSRGDLQAAQQFYNRALSIYGKLAPGSMDLARSLSGSGQVARSLGDLRAAQKDLMHALEIEGRLAPDSVDVATSLSELGAVSALLNDQQRSTDFYVRSSSILDRLAPNSLMFADTLIGLGNQAIRERRLQDADQFFKRAIAIVESQRSAIASTEDRALLLAQNREPYIGELRTQLALNDPADAFQTSERAHARSLLELLTEAHTQIRKGVEPALLKSEEALQQSLNAKARYQTRLLSGNHADEEIAAVSREIDELTLEYHDVETKIRSTSPHYAALTQPQPLSLKEVQQQVLEKDTLLLEYVLGDEASYLFTVTPISAKAYMLPKRAELESLAGKTYDALTARNRHGAGETLSQRDERIQKADAEYIRLAARLSKLILGPAASELDAKRLLIVGDGILLQIPFGALPEPSPNGSRALILSH